MFRHGSFVRSIFISLALLSVLIVSGCTGKENSGNKVLTKQVASEGIKRVNPEIKVISVNPGPVEGLWEIIVKRGTSLSIAYMDATGKLLFLGNVVNTFDKTSLTELRLNEVLTIDPAELPVKGTILMGKKDAPIKVHVFSDPECEYCALFHGQMLEVIAKREDIAFRIVLVPLIKIHPDAYAKSKTIMCAESDKEALKLLESAFTGEDLPPVPCENTIVEDNLNFLDKFNIPGTPTVIFPDGTRVQGAVQSDALIALALKAAGVTAQKADQRTKK